MIDARGYSCPTPMLMVQKAMERGNPDRLTVLVDTQCAVENVSHYAKTHGYQVVRTEQEDYTQLDLAK